jgi:hypothetical protein
VWGGVRGPTTVEAQPYGAVGCSAQSHGLPTLQSNLHQHTDANSHCPLLQGCHLPVVWLQCRVPLITSLSPPPPHHHHFFCRRSSPPPFSCTQIQTASCTQSHTATHLRSACSAGCTSSHPCLTFHPHGSPVLSRTHSHMPPPPRAPTCYTAIRCKTHDEVMPNPRRHF